MKIIIEIGKRIAFLGSRLAIIQTSVLLLPKREYRSRPAAAPIFRCVIGHWSPNVWQVHRTFGNKDLMVISASFSVYKNIEPLRLVLRRPLEHM